MLSKTPRVSIGMPVYNGANYISDAIESVLAQSFESFELVICDNASTDETEAICRDFAARDHRIKYFRNAENLGAGPNYNLTFHSSSNTEFFKWMAHDDVIAPTYLQKCVAALDASPDAVLCHTIISDIDEHSQEISQYESALEIARTSVRVSERFTDVILTWHRNSEIFALVRRNLMEDSVLHGDYYCQDKAFVANMSLRGRFLIVKEPLFGYRDHLAQFTQTFDLANSSSWHNTASKRWNDAAYLRLYINYVRMVNRDVHDGMNRIRCYGALVRWWFGSQNFYLVILGVLLAISPKLFRSVREVKGRLIARDERKKRVPGTPRISA